MAKEIVQINFNFSMRRSELENAFKSLVETFARMPGLLWKVWLMNEAEKEAAGIYLFDDARSAQRYLDGEIVAGLKKNPGVSNLSMKRFGILEELTRITRGPVSPKPA